MSLKNKLSLVIIGVIFFFGMLAVAFVFFQVESKLIFESEQGLESVSVTQAHGLSAVFQGGIELAETIADDETIVEYMRIKDVSPIIENFTTFNYNKGQVEISDEATLRRLLRYNIGNNYSAIYLMGTDGTTWVSTDETFTGQNYAFRDYFKEAIGGNFWVDVSIGVTSKQIGYYFSHSIKSTSGDVIGVAVVKMKPDLINQFITTNNLSDGEVTMITDSDGVVIFSNDNSRIYKSLGQISQEQLVLISEKKRFSGIDIEPMYYDDIQKELELIRDYKYFIINDKIEKKREIVSVIRLKNLPFYLLVVKDVEQFYGSSLYIASYLGLFILLTSIFAMGFIVFLVNRFLRPLEKLKDGARQLSQENFDINLDIKTGDELEDLADIFNQMSNKLKTTYNRLEDKLIKFKKLNRVMVGRELKMKEIKEDNRRLKNENNKK